MAQKTLSVKLSLNDKQFQSSLRKATRQMKKFGTSMKRTGQTLSRNLTLPLLAFGAASIAAFDKQAKAIAQVEAGIKSTGGAAGFTSKQLQKMASELQGKTLFGDEVILKDATSQLLTFTNIAGEQFARTQVAALNLATRLDGDLKSASIQLGKALNDPIANLSALSRSGIQFSVEQKKVIKELAETNRLAEAQNIILDELEKQYGGAAEAAAQAGAGGLKQLQNQFGDLMEEIGGMLLPIVIDLGNQFKTLLQGFKNLSPEAKKLIITVGILAGALGPLLIVLGSIVTIVATLNIKLIAIVAAVSALGLGIIYVVDNFKAFKERVNFDFLFNSIIKGVSMTLRGFGDLVSGYNKLIDKLGGGKLGILKASNEFDKLAENVEKALIETDDYKHDFEDFTTFMGRQGDRLKKFLKGVGESLGVGGDISTAPKFQKIPSKKPSSSFGVMTPAVIPDDLLKQMELFEEKERNINKLTEDLSNTFGQFGNILQSTFAQALQSTDGFFKTFVDGAKQAFKALMAQVAAMLAMKVILNAVGLGSVSELGDGLGGFLGSVLGNGISANANGGLIQKPHFGLIGEAGPEVVMPLNQFLNRTENGSGSIEVFGSISGQDILLSSTRARNNRTRTRGY